MQKFGNKTLSIRGAGVTKALINKPPRVPCTYPEGPEKALIRTQCAVAAHVYHNTASPPPI